MCVSERERESVCVGGSGLCGFPGEATVDVLFNSQNLWANVQSTSCAEMMKWELDETSQWQTLFAVDWDKGEAHSSPPLFKVRSQHTHSWVGLLDGWLVGCSLVDCLTVVTQTHSLSLTLTHTHTPSLTHTHTLSLSLSLTHIHTHPH